MTNPLLDGMVKIGFSMKDPYLRATEGFDPAGLPDNFVVGYMAFVEEPRLVEQLCHSLLDEHRYKKEWFRVSVCKAAETIVAATEKHGANIVFESERPTDSADSRTHSVLEHYKSNPDQNLKVSTPKLRFVYDYLGWDAKRKAWVLKAVAKLVNGKWALEVTERFDGSQSARTWMVDSVEELKAYCRQYALEVEAFNPGRMNPILGKPKSVTQ